MYVYHTSKYVLSNYNYFIIYQKEQQNDILWLLPPVVHIEKRKQTQCVICNIKDANNALHSQLIGSIGCRGTGK